MPKPQRAVDIEIEKLTFPKIAMPKIDGVRGFNPEGTILQRTLKPLGNKLLTAKYSGPEFLGFDGELALAGQETSWSLCRETTSAVRSGKKGLPDIEWHLFDFVHPSAIHLPYLERLIHLGSVTEQQRGLYLALGIKVVPWRYVHDMEDFLVAETFYMEAGYEGIILRDPNGMHKDGKATVKSGSYLRRKPFVDFEGEVVSFTEAMENQNEAKTNLLGRTERSTHQENMVPKGMIGNIQLKVLADVEYMGKVLIKKDEVVTVGPGEMTHEDRLRFFQHPGEFLGEIGKAKFFAHGQKDKPRMATWKCFRDKDDIVLED